MSDHHATFGLKKETPHNNSCTLPAAFSCTSPTDKRSPFLLVDPPVTSATTGREGFDIDMDLAKFLGDPDTAPSETR